MCESTFESLVRHGSNAIAAKASHDGQEEIIFLSSPRKDTIECGTMNAQGDRHLRNEVDWK